MFFDPNDMDIDATRNAFKFFAAFGPAQRA
jgi:hypothetical protein